MKKIIIYFLLLVPLWMNSQVVNWRILENKKQWNAILKSAGKEYKNVLVYVDHDSCKDCTSMHDQVYTDTNFIFYLNREYIPVNIDKENLSLVRADYTNLIKECNITSFPAYLIYSPGGQLVHKGQGFLSTPDMIALLRTAADPARQYYPLLHSYESGRKDYGLMKDLALTARELGDTAIADRIATDFKENFLNKLSDEDLCRATYINFIFKFINVLNTSDRFFKLFYEKAKMVDAEMYEDCADRFVTYMIAREEITDKLWKNKQAISPSPDWDKIYDNIARKYNKDYAERLLPGQKLGFYRQQNDWHEFVKIRNEQLRNKPPKAGGGIEGDPWVLNAQAWDIFLNCNDTTILKMALHWSDIAISLDPENVQFYDTRANLLHKLGNTEDAIAWENYAIRLGIVQGEQLGFKTGLFYKEYTDILEKMKKNQPTWPSAQQN